MRQNLEGEAKGAIVHELVHVVQQYGRAQRGATPRRPRLACGGDRRLHPLVPV